MAQTTQAAGRPGFAFARIMGATALALGILLGVLGGQQRAAAANPTAPTPAVTDSGAAGEARLVQAGFKFRKHFGHGYGHRFKSFGFKHGYGVKRHGFKHHHGFKHGHRAKRFGYGHGHHHSFKKHGGFKKYGFGHRHGVKRFGHRYY